MSTPTEARAIIQPVINGCNDRRDSAMYWARLTRDNGGSRDTVTMLVHRARRHNQGARRLLRELRRLEAAS